jgi:CRP-like cAMP-binding protein
MPTTLQPARPATPSPPRPATSAAPLQILAVRPGRRPVDEGIRPGTGSTAPLGLVGGSTGDDVLCVLFRPTKPVTGVRLSAWFVPRPTGALTDPVPVPGLQHLPVPPRHVGPPRDPGRLRDAGGFDPDTAQAYVAALRPGHDLVPGPRWMWPEADPALRAATPDGQDPFTFTHQYTQRVRVELTVDDQPEAGASIEIDIVDVDRFGSLYERLLTRLVRPDTRRQARERGLSRVWDAYHPWYPVLAIGLAKARRYLHAVREDVSRQRHNLPDPAWLMRVGIYLELLTFLGIAEAVRDEYPDLLNPAERRCVEHSPAFAQIRRRIDPTAWRRVWQHRDIVPAAGPLTAAGPVDIRNLLRKETANLAFLEVHHDDLRHALQLAGPEPSGGRRAWQRVFRDAERAVLQTSAEVFPELRHLGPAVTEFVCWHEAGQFPVPAPVPPWLTALFGDRDGLYPTAARHYRRSMNEVATWARECGLMAHPGAECIPADASLIESRLRADTARCAALDAADGLATDAGGDTHGIPAGLLHATRVFAPLTVAQTAQLAAHSVRRELAPGDLILREGQHASALHIVERGTVQITVRQPDDVELAVATVGPADVLGEHSLLTGQPASATVRALDRAIIHEIPGPTLRALLQQRPDLAVELTLLLGQRRAHRHHAAQRYLFGRPPHEPRLSRLASIVRDALLTGASGRLRGTRGDAKRPPDRA